MQYCFKYWSGAESHTYTKESLPFPRRNLSETHGKKSVGNASSCLFQSINAAGQTWTVILFKPRVYMMKCR